MRNQSNNLKENKIKILKIIFICVNVILLPHNLFVAFLIFGDQYIGDSLHEFNKRGWFLQLFFNEERYIYLSLTFLYLTNMMLCYFLLNKNKKYYWLLILYFIYNLLGTFFGFFGYMLETYSFNHSDLGF